MKKTKAIILQQRNIPYNKSDFYLNGYILEKVLKNKYLGNLIEASGKFHSTHIELSKKGSKVMFSMLRYLNPIGVSGSLLGVYLGLFSLPGNMEVYGFLPP